MLLTTPTASDCDNNYTNNRVLSGRAIPQAPFPFATGELGRVHKVDVHRSRIDVLIDVEEPLLVAFRDGPFELYDQVHCKVELEVEVPREDVRERAEEELDGLLLELAERFDDLSAAQAAAGWNRRQVEPFPEDYEQVLLEYGAWKRALLTDRLAELLDDADQLVRYRVRDNAAYGDGFTHGLKRSTSYQYAECAGILDAVPVSSSGSPPSDYESSDKSEWRRGYRDGSTLASTLSLAQRLSECLRELAR